MLMPQQKTTEEEAQSSSDPVPMETVVEAPAPLVEVPMAEIASKGTKVQLPGADEPSLPDSTRVTTERTDPVVAEVTGATPVEVTVAVIHQEDMAAMLPTQSEEGPGAEIQPEAMETGPIEEPVAVLSEPSIRQELSDIFPERGVPGEESVQTPVETAAEVIQAGGDPDPSEDKKRRLKMTMRAAMSLLCQRTYHRNPKKVVRVEMETQVTVGRNRTQSKWLERSHRMMKSLRRRVVRGPVKESLPRRTERTRPHARRTNPWVVTTATWDRMSRLPQEKGARMTPQVVVNLSKRRTDRLLEESPVKINR